MTSKLGILVRCTTNSLEYAANRSTLRCRHCLSVRAQRGGISFAACANTDNAVAIAGARYDLRDMVTEFDVWITPALAFK